MSKVFFSLIRKVCLLTALLGATNSQAGLIAVSFINSGFGLFDTRPELLRECEDDNKCIALIPNKFSPSWVFSQNIVNYSDNGNDK